MYNTSIVSGWRKVEKVRESIRRAEEKRGDQDSSNFEASHPKRGSPQHGLDWVRVGHELAATRWSAQRGTEQELGPDGEDQRIGRLLGQFR